MSPYIVGEGDGTNERDLPFSPSKPSYAALVALVLASVTYPPGVGRFMASRVRGTELGGSSEEPPFVVPVVCISPSPPKTHQGKCLWVIFRDTGCSCAMAEPSLASLARQG